jgi:hypothetical protein
MSSEDVVGIWQRRSRSRSRSSRRRRRSVEEEEWVYLVSLFDCKIGGLILVYRIRPSPPPPTIV